MVETGAVCGTKQFGLIAGGIDVVGGPHDDRVNVIQKSHIKNSIISRELRCNKIRIVQITVGEVDGCVPVVPHTTTVF